MPSELVIDNIRKALGRRGPLKQPPAPPVIDEHMVRLVSSDIGLPELFAERAGDMKMLVEMTRVDDLLPKLLAFLREYKCKSAMLSATPLLAKLNVLDYLTANGLSARSWQHMTADETYDIDAGITEADYAVAETGTLAIRHTPEHGRLLSLVPFVHVAIVQPKIFLPDLVDLFDRLKTDGAGSGVTLISGPSKTSDIEMTDGYRGAWAECGEDVYFGVRGEKE